MVRLRLSGDPFVEFERRMQDMDSAFRALRTRTGTRVFPPINLYDDGENLIVLTEVPGVDKKDLDITVTGDVLSIKGERRIEAASPNASYHRRERDYGVFRRSITLPERVDSTKVTAAYQNGVLQIMLPRAEEAKPRKVEI